MRMRWNLEAIRHTRSRLREHYAHDNESFKYNTICTYSLRIVNTYNTIAYSKLVIRTF